MPHNLSEQKLKLTGSGARPELLVTSVVLVFLQQRFLLPREMPARLLPKIRISLRKSTECGFLVQKFAIMTILRLVLVQKFKKFTQLYFLQNYRFLTIGLNIDGSLLSIIRNYYITLAISYCPKIKKKQNAFGIALSSELKNEMNYSNTFALHS